MVLVFFVQIEIKMKKTEAIQWEKLEGEGTISNVKHFTPSQCQFFVILLVCVAGKF